MTRSSARRRNRNARNIVSLVPAADALKRCAAEGMFTPHDAQRWVRFASPYLWPTPPQETNWELTAELLNKKSRFCFEVRAPGFTPTPRHSARLAITGHILVEW